MGPAGIGKSRLAWEFRKYIDGLVETTYWHNGRSPAYGEGITFWALGEMIRERLRPGRDGRRADDPRQGRPRRSPSGSPIRTRQRWIERALLTLLGVESGMAADQLFGAWRTFFERIAGEGHGHARRSRTCTSPTRACSTSSTTCSSGAAACPIYVVTLARPDLLERRPAWGAGKRNFISLYLEPLPEADMRQLLAGLVPGLPETAVATIVGRADGIPLYAVETVRMLVADGRLVERGRRLRAARRPDDAGRAGDADRAHRVAPRCARRRRTGASSMTPRCSVRASRCGRAAAVAGRRGGRPRADACQPRPARAARSARWTRARRSAASTPSSRRSSARWPTTRSSKKDRKKRHLAAARYFESLGNDELAGALASHYLAAHANAAEGAEADALAAQARIALKGAAERAAALGGHDQAVAFLEQALTVTTRPGRPGRAPRAGRGIVSGKFRNGEAALRRAIEVSRSAGDAAGVVPRRPPWAVPSIRGTTRPRRSRSWKASPAKQRTWATACSGSV